MENEKFLPTGWHWKITPEQIEKIKERDRDTINKVYFDNLDKFKRMAKGYCYIIKRRELVDDCTQQIYADMVDYDYIDTRTLFYSIRRSFWTACGLPRGVPYQNILSLDMPLYNDDDGRTLADKIIDKHNFFDDDAETDAKHVLAMIAAQTHLTDNQRDILTAIAFGCCVYKGLFKYAQSSSV